MAKLDGRYVVLEILIQGIYTPIGCLSSNSLSESLSTIGSITDGWASSRPTNQGYEIPFDGIVSVDDNGGAIVSYQDLQQIKRSKTLIDWRITTTIGNSQIGKGYITNLKDGSGVNEFMSFSGEIVGWGAITNISSTGVKFDSTVITFDSTVITWDAVNG
jgi:hypothetical protein